MNPLADVTIIRSTFSMAGQTLAIHVVGDPIADNNGVFYVYGDHLGSTTLLTYGLTAVGDDHAAAGDPVPNTLAHYTPFGDWRTEPTQTMTDRGFTGHRSNNKGSDGIGLIYMNA
ncbi:MAG: hypothetical protein KC425_18350, partial [Anaerolineales bacterium]|nr:hypothetical protein [Anaerolineales bacterium]